MHNLKDAAILQKAKSLFAHMVSADVFLHLSMIKGLKQSSNY